MAYDKKKYRREYMREYRKKYPHKRLENLQRLKEKQDIAGTIECKSCKRVLPLSEFYGGDDKPKHSWCKDCGRKNRQERYQNNVEQERERVNAYRKTENGKISTDKMEKKRRGTEEYKRACKNTMLLRNYGISLLQYEEMRRLQDERCKICLVIFDNAHPIGKDGCAVDHIHGTKIVRGLLCNNCNNGLGRFKDNIQSLLNAVGYLSKYQ